MFYKDDNDLDTEMLNMTNLLFRHLNLTQRIHTLRNLKEATKPT